MSIYDLDKELDYAFRRLDEDEPIYNTRALLTALSDERDRLRAALRQQRDRLRAALRQIAAISLHAGTCPECGAPEIARRALGEEP